MIHSGRTASPRSPFTPKVSIEFEFFLIAVRNVLRAQERLPADLRPAMTDQRLLHLTRNIAEHWDEVGGWSAEAFASEYPDRTLGQISATNKEVFVSEVPLTRVIAWLARVNRALTQAIENAGDALPTDDASMVSGGDDLPWPPERRRERLPCPSAAWRAFLAVGLRGDHLLAYASRAPQSDECANEHWRDTAEGCGQTCRRWLTSLVRRAGG